MVYKYSWSGYERPVKAEKVAQHLADLERVNGVVTRLDFVDSARDANSEFHCLFEWDDTIAGEKYRLHQASTIIRAIRIDVEREEKKPLKISAYVMPERSEKKGGFINIKRAIDDRNSRDELLRKAKQEMKWFIDKYAGFEELAAVIDAMKEVLSE